MDELGDRLSLVETHC